MFEEEEEKHGDIQQYEPYVPELNQESVNAADEVERNLRMIKERTDRERLRAEELERAEQLSINEKYQRELEAKKKHQDEFNQLKINEQRERERVRQLENELINERKLTSKLLYPDIGPLHAIYSPVVKEVIVEPVYKEVYDIYGTNKWGEPIKVLKILKKPAAKKLVVKKSKKNKSKKTKAKK